MRLVLPLASTLFVVAVFGPSVEAAEPAPEPPPALEALPWQAGPQPVALGHELSLALPEGYSFLGAPQAGVLLARYGHLHNETLAGVIVSTREGDDFIVTVDYVDSGYVRDDEKLDAGGILETIRDATTADNPEREKKGFPALTVDGWSEAPRYDRALHHVVWALRVSDRNGSSINFNTRVLGRRGFVSLDLVTSPERLEGSKPHAATLLAATAFAPGARYSDFDATHDRVAEFGLVGLVLGGLGIAKLAKLGLLAVFWKSILAFLLAAKKLIVLGFVAVGGLVRRVLGRDKKAIPESSASDAG